MLVAAVCTPTATDPEDGFAKHAPFRSRSDVCSRRGRRGRRRVWRGRLSRCRDDKPLTLRRPFNVASRPRLDCCSGTAIAVPVGHRRRGSRFWRADKQVFAFHRRRQLLVFWSSGGGGVALALRRGRGRRCRSQRAAGNRDVLTPNVPVVAGFERRLQNATTSSGERASASTEGSRRPLRENTVWGTPAVFSSRFSVATGDFDRPLVPRPRLFHWQQDYPQLSRIRLAAASSSLRLGSPS